LYPVRSEVCALPPPQERGEEGVGNGLLSPSGCVMPLAPGGGPYVPQGWWTGKMGS